MNCRQPEDKDRANRWGRR